MTASQRQSFLSLWFIATIGLLASCSDGEQKSPQEPVAAATDTLAKESVATESAGLTGEPKDAGGTLEPVAATTEQGEQPVGEAEPVPEVPLDGEVVAVIPAEPAPFQEGGLGESPQATDVPVEQSLGGAHGRHKHKAKGGKQAKVGRGKGTRFVKANTLNVRSKPSARASVVRKLQAGEEVQIVSKKGKWVKIAKGQWVQSKFLSPKAPGG